MRPPIQPACLLPACLLLTACNWANLLHLPVACRCGPCRAFTPTLARVYETVKSKHDDFAIVFVSADRNPQQFEVGRADGTA